MKHITVDFTKPGGTIKPMHAVNNGPMHKANADMRVSNLEAWKEAGIPYARTHDSASCSTYGGPHTVDVNLIFPDFGADPEDPASYDFACTDEYLRVIGLAGAKVFYRLGAGIEHQVKKYNTLPPKDFKKWAVVCEHIIRHYTEGWADGFNYDIQYWEIWNEPDLDPDDAANKRTWGGTRQQFFDLYETTAKHLKSAFPHLSIGGPALAGRDEWAEDFLGEMHARRVPIDFFSWHIYATEPSQIAARAAQIKAMLVKHGCENAESILDEWNYVAGWSGEEFVYSKRQIKGLKGASFTLATMCACLNSPVDMLMYYDARPCGFNGLFSTDFVCDRLKGYYPFKMFNELYTLQNGVRTEADEHFYAAAAQKDEKAALVFTHYCDDDKTPSTEVELAVKGLPEGRVRVRFYLLDRDHDASLVREDVFSGEWSTVLDADLFGSYLVTLEKEC